MLALADSSGLVCLVFLAAGIKIKVERTPVPAVPADRTSEGKHVSESEPIPFCFTSFFVTLSLFFFFCRGLSFPLPPRGYPARSHAERASERCFVTALSGVR